MLTQEERDVVLAARDLIADRKHWTTGASARDWAGVAVVPLHPQAARWCVIGAVHRAAFLVSGVQLLGGEGTMGLPPVIETVMRKLNAASVVAFKQAMIMLVNDHIGHDETIAVCDKVLADETIA